MEGGETFNSLRSRMEEMDEESDRVYSLVQDILEAVLFSEKEPVLILLPPMFGGEESHLVKRARRVIPANREMHWLDDSEPVSAQVQRLIEEKAPLTLVFMPIYGLTHDLFFEHIEDSPEDDWSELPSDFGQPPKRQKIPQWQAQRDAIRTAAEFMPVGSLLATVVRDESLSFRGYRSSDYLTEIGTLRYIIKFDFSVVHDISLGTFNWSQGNLLRWEARGETNAPLRFFKIPNSTTSAKEVIEDFKRLSQQPAGTTRFGYVRRAGTPPPEETWLFDAHHPRLHEKVADMQHYGRVVPLEAVAEVFAGSGELNTLQEWYVVKERDDEYDNQISMVDADNLPLLAAHSAQFPDLIFRADSDFELFGDAVTLQADDICIGPTVGHPWTVVKILSTELPLIAADSVVVIRPRDGVEADFLVNYLRSQSAHRWLAAHGGIAGDRLKSLPVPILDETLRAASNSVMEAIRGFAQLKREAEMALSALYDFESARDARMHLLTTGQQVRQRLRAARQIDDFDSRVRMSFPHPIAYRWRTIEAAQPDLEGFLRVLHTAEALACYLASMAILMARAVDDFQISYTDSLVRRFSQSRHGTSFGDWIAILREVRDAKVLKQSSEHIPFYEVSRFLDSEQADRALQLLKDNRDSQAHGKGAEGIEVSPVFRESREALRILLQEVEFLSDYSLRYVENTRRDTLASVTNHSYRELMGDHPVVPLLQAETPESEIEEGSLYLVDRNGKLHLLRPLLERRRCPTCGQWATFHLDSYDPRTDMVTLKAMEHAHTLEDTRIASAFRRIALLPPRNE